MRGTANPINPVQRHSLIDALRGMALAGVLLANIGWLCLYEFMTDAERAALPTAGFDAFGLTLMQWFVNVKAITVFSILFGVGFALQIDRAERRGDGGLRRFLRRLFWLLVIGVLHSYLLWWGDILLIYAVCGFLLVLFRRVPDGVLLWGGLFIALVLPGLIQPALNAVAPEATRAEVYAAGLHGFQSSSLAHALSVNTMLANWTRLSNWTLLCFVLGRFLLGYWAGRKGLLQDPHRHLAHIRRLFWISLLAAVIPLLLLKGVDVFAQWPREGAGRVVRNVLQRLSPLALGIAYALAFAWMFTRPRTAKALEWLAPVGRMALTHYLMQSVIGIALFYGIGLDIGPRYGVPGWWLAFVAIFAAQIVFSHWWLARFRFGPCEWAWRSLTYGAPQPMRLPKVALAS